jgi:hypothetical protein
MPELFEMGELMDFLGEDATDTDLTAQVEDLADRVEALLNAECGRSDRPFQAAELAREEIHDGTGGRTLYLDYPVTTLTAVALGTDPDEPEVELEVADPTKVQFRAGHRRIRRLDGAFGCQGDPGFVHVTYDAAADIPAFAGLAVMRRVASLWRNRGSEDATSERYGGAAVELVNGAPDEVWKRVVAPFASGVG